MAQRKTKIKSNPFFNLKISKPKPRPKPKPKRTSKPTGMFKLGIAPKQTKRDMKARRTAPFKDYDKDGVVNVFDCKPFDKKRQDTLVNPYGRKARKYRGQVEHFFKETDDLLVKHKGDFEKKVRRKIKRGQIPLGDKGMRQMQLMPMSFMEFEAPMFALSGATGKPSQDEGIRQKISTNPSAGSRARYIIGREKGKNKVVGIVQRGINPLGYPEGEDIMADIPVEKGIKEVEDIYIRPQYRGKGYGKMAVSALFKEPATVLDKKTQEEVEKYRKLEKAGMRGTVTLDPGVAVDPKYKTKAIVGLAQDQSIGFWKKIGTRVHDKIDKERDISPQELVHSVIMKTTTPVKGFTHKPTEEEAKLGIELGMTSMHLLDRESGRSGMKLTDEAKRHSPIVLTKEEFDDSQDFADEDSSNTPGLDQDDLHTMADGRIMTDSSHEEEYDDYKHEALPQTDEVAEWEAEKQEKFEEFVKDINPEQEEVEDGTTEDKEEEKN